MAKTVQPKYVLTIIPETKPGESGQPSQAQLHALDGVLTEDLAEKLLDGAEEVQIRIAVANPAQVWIEVT